MELGREMFECPMFPLGSILAPIATDWYWVDTKRGAAVMAIEETPGDATDVGSHPVLSATPRVDEPAVAVGERPETGLGLIDQMDELTDLLRQFARNAAQEAKGYDDPWQKKVCLDAEKALFRMVDLGKRFVHEYR